MATRVTEIGSSRYTVWVNTIEQTPTYVEKGAAITRGAREARTHNHVQVTRSTGGRAPRTIAEWRKGERVL